MTISRSSRAVVAIVGALVAPTIAPAQDTTLVGPRRTHVVQPGETLWALARQYLNDPWQWREIFRLNTGVVHDPHWIYPGQALVLPGTPPAAVAAARPGGDAAPGEPVSPPEPTVFARGETGRSDEAPSVPPVPAPARMAPPVSAAAIRVGELVSAPWVGDSVPSGSGRVVGSGDVPGIPLTESLRRLQLRERVFVAPPAGATGRAGERYVVFRPDLPISGAGTVLVPTGVLVAERAVEEGVVQTHVAAEYGDLRIGQSLLPLVLPAIDTAARPRPVAGGAVGRVAWISGGVPELPTLLSYVVIRGRPGDFHAGDQVTLVREAYTASGVDLPETEIAVARVVRVDDGTASAIVLRQFEPGIRLGTLARVTARLP